ncbi:MAG: hypothetical protein ACK4FV_07660, partial [Candidatus Nitrosocaldus sp.]
LMPHFGISVEPDTVFKVTMESIREWVSIVKDLLDEGYTQDVIEARMVEHVKCKGLNEPIPMYVINSIRNSVRGIINYCSR